MKAAAAARPCGSGRLQLNARLVREKDRARARELRRLAFYGAVIVVPLLVYVWQRVEFIRLSYSVEALGRQRQQLQERGKELTVERSLLLAPDRIESVARRQLGLTDPAPADVKRVQVIDGHVDEIAGTVARAVGPDRGAAARGAAATERSRPGTKGPRAVAGDEGGTGGGEDVSAASLLPFSMPRVISRQDGPATPKEQTP
jgi:cell division protein FtsL